MGTDHYGFTNIIVSHDPEDRSTAVLVQASPDDGVLGMTASLELVGAGLSNVQAAARSSLMALILDRATKMRWPARAAAG